MEESILKASLDERSYDIMVGSNNLIRVVDFLRERNYSKKGIVTNETIYRIYKDTIEKLSREIDGEVFIIPDGEEYKNILWFYYLHGMLLKKRFDRSSLLIAFGGGVIGDITGFVASTYMRGIDYIQVPTTLLAQVDSSVGGKTGINHPLGKNMIGTFYQPVIVVIDVDMLKTLPEREFRAGMAEVIKYGVIWSKDLFMYLREYHEDIKKLSAKHLIHIIRESLKIKAEVVSKDEKESGLRAILNYGHTVGHSIETLTDYRTYLHGEAVAMGMYAEARISEIVMGIEPEVATAVKELITLYDLPSEIPSRFNPEDILRTMELDKKARGGKLKMALPLETGRVVIKTVERNDVIRGIESAKR